MKTEYKQISITLPRKMLQQVEQSRKQESRTRSEFFREALRRYFLHSLPSERPTAREQAAVKRGITALKDGETYPLSSVLHDLER